MKMKKIVINKCYGGFSLSPKAVKRLAELKGKECFFFKQDIEISEYTPISESEIGKSLFWTAFSVSNPKKYLPEKERDKDGGYGHFNEAYSKIDLTSRPESKTDLDLIKVIEELGDEANGSCAELKIVEIPEDVEYEIDEYDGLESIHEVHRSWG